MREKTIRADIDKRVALVIPLYNHGERVAGVIREALQLKLPVIVVDDGSTDAGAEIIRRMDGIRVLRHSRNQGKGAAIMTGLNMAAGSADWAVTLDADGQHHPEDAVRLIQAIPMGQRPLIVGCRMGMRREKAPWTSRFGRGFSNFWVWISGGPRLTDSQSGFRLYPLPEVLDLGIRARRFQFEVEVLVKAGWTRMSVIEVPVRVTYQAGNQRISHFRPFMDFMRNFSTFSRLILLRIFLPRSVRSHGNKTVERIR